MEFGDIENAFFFVSSAPCEMNCAVLNRETREIFYRSEMGDFEDISEDDLDSDKYVEIPHKNELDLGHELVFDFVGRHLPDEYDRIHAMFAKRGAYGRFKDLLQSNGLLETWYEFQSQREEQALREWCKDNGIELSD